MHKVIKVSRAMHEEANANSHNSDLTYSGLWTRFTTRFRQ